MEEYQKRVVVERDELEGRLLALRCFIDGGGLDRVDDLNKVALPQQLGFMVAYRAVLDTRILAFTEDGR